MLRFSLMPSDYHPHLLMLGENSDITGLAQALSAFARDRCDNSFETSGAARSSDTRVRLTAEPGPRGVHPSGSDLFDVVWRLDAEQASEFAERLLDLAAADRLSGSEHLDCTVEGEIPVWVSKGEFAEDFLKR